MKRPFAITGFSMFAALFIFCLFGWTAAFAALVCAAALIPISFAIRRLRKDKSIITALISVALSAVLFMIAYNFQYAPAVKYIDKQIKLEAQICRVPYYEYGKYYYDVTAVSINGSADDSGIKFKLTSQEKLSADFYDTVKLTAKVYKLGRSSEFSRMNYASEGLFLGAYTYGKISVIPREGKKPVNYYILKLRQRLISGISSNLSKENAGLCTAMLLGDKAYMSDEVKTAMSDAGISHIICVSGLHLSILSGAVLSLMNGLGVSFRKKNIIAMIFVLSFMTLCGFSASIVRAGIMMLVFLLGEIILNQSDSLNSLGFSLMLLLLNPFNAGSISLCLSALATLAIISVAPKIIGLLKPRFADKNGKISAFKKPAFALAEIMAVSLSVMIVSLPYTVFVFKRITLIAVAANILIIPIASVLLESIAFLSLLSIINLPAVERLFAVISAHLSKYVIKIAAFLNEFYYAVINAHRVYISAFVISALVALALIAIFKFKSKAAYRLICFMLAIELAFGASFELMSRKEDVIITCLATGTSPIITVENQGKLAIIGCGENYNTYSKLKAQISDSGADYVSAYFLWNDYENTIGGISDVFSKFRINRAIIPDNDYIAEGVKRYSDSEIIVSEAGEYYVTDSVKISYCYCEYPVFKISAKGRAFLFTTSKYAEVSELDEEFKGYDYLISAGKPNINVVKSSLNGIIILSSDEYGSASAFELSQKGYDTYLSGDISNLEIIINQNNIKIRSITSWA